MPEGEQFNERGSKHPASLFSIYVPKFYEAMRLGNSQRSSCLQIGLNPETMSEWVWKGRKWPEKFPEYAELVTNIGRIRAEVQAEMVEVVRNTALSERPNTWQAAAWYLERTDPENWGRRDKVSINSEGGPLIQLNQVVLGDADAREASRDLLNRLAAGVTSQSLGPGDSGEPPALGSGSGAGSRLEDIDVDPRKAR